MKTFPIAGPSITQKEIDAVAEATASTIVAPARSSAAMKRSATSSRVNSGSASQPDRSAEKDAGAAGGSIVSDYSQPPHG